MSANHEKNYLYLAWGVITISFVFRLFLAPAFLLVPDETNYWQWSRYLAWGYHDQAPLIAWAIKASTFFYGQTELGVRFPSIAAMTIASIYILLICRRWFSARIAYHAVLLTQVILIFQVGGLLATADGLQAAAWAAAGYYAARAVERNAWSHWLAAGACFGAGMLSKYTMILFAGCIFLFLLFSRSHRRHLFSFKPYGALVLGLLMFSPVIFWNAHNDWNSVRHVAYIGGADERFSLHLKFLGDYLGSQAGLLSPLVFLLFAGSWYKALRERHLRDQWIVKFLVFTSLPVIAGFAVLSLHTRVYGNWPCAGYMTATALAAGVWLPDVKKRIDKKRNASGWFWRVSLLSSAVITILALIHVVRPIIPIPVKLDRIAHETVGWDKVGQRAGELYNQMPRPEETFIFGKRYQMASELAFYMPGKPRTVSINRWNRPNVYDYWWQDAQLIGLDALGVMRDKKARNRLLSVFERVDPPIRLPVYYNPFRPGGQGDPVLLKAFYFYKCYGFKGGIRWLPPDKDDVRVSD